MRRLILSLSGAVEARRCFLLLIPKTWGKYSDFSPFIRYFAKGFNKFFELSSIKAAAQFAATFGWLRRYFRSEKQKKKLFFFCFSLTYSYLWLEPKVLPLGKAKEKAVFLLLFALLFVPLAGAESTSARKSQRKKFFSLAFRSLIRTFAPVIQVKKRPIASWLLLAVFVPMVLLSSLHIHDIREAIETECTDCSSDCSAEGSLPGKNCHGHMTATPTWAHDCVLCQFLTLSMLAAAVTAVTTRVHVCKKNYAQPSCSYCAVSCGAIVTRGPPSL